MPTEKCFYLVLIPSLTFVAVLLPLVLIQTDHLQRPSYVYLSTNRTDTTSLNNFPEKSYSLSEIFEYLEEFAKERSFLFTVAKIGETLPESNPIYELVMKKKERTRNSVLIVSGLLGKDCLSVWSSIQIMHKFFSDVQRTNRLLNKFNFHFLPLLNPDGYQFSQSLPIYSNWVSNFQGFRDNVPIGNSLLDGFGDEGSKTTEITTFMKYFQSNKGDVKAAFFLFSPSVVNFTSGRFTVARRDTFIDDLSVVVEHEGETHFKYAKTEGSHPDRIDKWVLKEKGSEEVLVVDLMAHFGAQPPEILRKITRKLGNDAHFIITRLIEVLYDRKKMDTNYN